MLNISRAVVDLAQAAVPLPSTLTDETAVRSYLGRLTPGLAKLIVEIATAVQTGRIGLIGSGVDELRGAIAEDLEARGLASVDPSVIQAIVTIIVFIISLLRKTG